MNLKPYFDFVRYAIESQPNVPESAKGIDWVDFFEFCLRQGIVGIVFDGIERSGIHIPQAVLFEWIGTAEVIKANNFSLNKKSNEVSRFWNKQGYRSCILKGQANAMMYPKPELRTPGDIDIWVDNLSETCNIKEIIQIAQREAPNGNYSLHHVTMPIYSEVSIEVHYRPVFLDIMWKDRKLQRYINKVKNCQFNNRITLNDNQFEICGLTDEFNAVFLILHMWHHLLSTRNNLKQLIDYYYLLMRDIPKEKRKEIARLFHDFGVLKYAQGIMWIEHKILGLPEQYLIVEQNEKIGKLLLDETIHYGESQVSQNKSLVFINSITSNIRLLRYFPSAVLFSPIHLIWHQWWKLKMRIKLNLPHYKYD